MLNRLANASQEDRFLGLAGLAPEHALPQLAHQALPILRQAVAPKLIRPALVCWQSAQSSWEWRTGWVHLTYLLVTSNGRTFSGSS